MSSQVSFVLVAGRILDQLVCRDGHIHLVDVEVEVAVSTLLEYGFETLQVAEAFRVVMLDVVFQIA